MEGSGFNNAVKGVLTRFLSQPRFKLQDREVEDLVNAIKDWIDADSEVTGTGAENAYYQGLGKSYTARNGPMESIDELLLVRGVTRELFYGTPERPGLARFLTVYGEGKININTAPKEVLQALAPAITEDMANRMDDYRRNPRQQPDRSVVVQESYGMESMTLDSGMLSTKSDSFQIISTGHLGAMKRTIRGIVKRDSEKKLSVVAWRLG